MAKEILHKYRGYLSLRSGIKGISKKTANLLDYRIKILSANFFLQLFTFASTPFVLRLYSPGQFGSFTILLLATNVSSLFFLFGLNDLLFSHRSHRLATQLLGSLFLYLPFLSLFASISASIFLPLFSSLNLFSNLPLFLLFWFLVCLLMLNSCFISYSQRIHNFSLVTSLSLRFALVRPFLQAIAFFVSPFYGLPLSECISRLFSLFAFPFSVALHPIRHPWVLRHIQESSTFLVIRSISVLLSSVIVVAPVFIISKLFDSSTSGQFSLAFTLLAAPLALYQKSYADPLGSRFRNSYVTNKQSVLALAYKSLYKSLLFTIVFYIALLVSSQFLIPLIFGPQWHLVSHIVFIMSIWFASMMFSLPYQYIFTITQKPLLRLCIDFVSLLLFFLLMYFQQSTSLPFYSFLWLMAFSLSLISLLNTIAAFRLLRH